MPVRLCLSLGCKTARFTCPHVVQVTESGARLFEKTVASSVRALPATWPCINPAKTGDNMVVRTLAVHVHSVNDPICWNDVYPQNRLERGQKVLAPSLLTTVRALLTAVTGAVGW